MVQVSVRRVTVISLFFLLSSLICVSNAHEEDHHARKPRARPIRRRQLLCGDDIKGKCRSNKRHRMLPSDNESVRPHRPLERELAETPLYFNESSLEGVLRDDECPCRIWQVLCILQNRCIKALDPNPSPGAPSQVPSQMPSPSQTPICCSFSENPGSSSIPSIDPTPETSQMPTTHSSQMPSPHSSPASSSIPSIGPTPEISQMPTYHSSQVPTMSLPTTPPLLVASEMPSAAPQSSPEPSHAPFAVGSVEPTTVASETPSALQSQRPTLRPSLLQSEEPTTVPRVVQVLLPVALFGGDEFLDTTSHQYKALEWLLDTDVSSLSDERIIQRYALACIYYATFNVTTEFTLLDLGDEIEGWTNDDGWITETSECNWDGVDCDLSNRVTGLDFFRNFLTGEFPKEVVLMAETLEALDLGGNFVFTIGDDFNPYLGMLTALRELFYDETNFVNDNGIPTEIGNLKNLEFYSCYEVRYTGEIDGAAFPSDLIHLTYIDFEYNSFGSTMPLSIGNLPTLFSLFARNCSLDGDLEFMRNMAAIEEVWISFNPGLQGSLPEFIGDLDTLFTLRLDETGFTGPIPASWGNLDWEYLDLGFNALTGFLPDTLCENPPSFMRADCVHCPVGGCCTSCYLANGTEVDGP